MATYPRKTHNVFGASGVSSAPSTFSQFGSETAGSPLFTTDIETLQELPAWGLGWPSAVWPANKAPLIEDWNSWCYEHSYQIGSIFEEGLPIWDPGTVYDIGSWVQDPSNLGQVFQSLAASNEGNAPPNGNSSAQWRWANPPLAVLPATLTANVLPKVGGASGTGPAGSQTLVASAISDDGVNVILAEPLKFADGSIQPTAAVNNAPSAQSANLAGTTRSLNTNYYNTTNKPIYVSVVVSGGNPGIICYCNPCTSPTTPTLIVSQAYPDGPVSGNVNAFFIVLPGYGYRVQQQFGAITTWIEWT